MPSPDTQTLIAACLRGDDQAKAAFYVEFSGLVRRAVARRLLAMAGLPPLQGEIGDIVNEVFEKLLRDDCRMLSQLYNPACIHAWLVSVARNHTVDYIRKLAARDYGHAIASTESLNGHPSPPKPVHASFETDLDRRDRTAGLARCLEALSEEERLIINLFYVQSLKYVQIAEILGMNVNTLSAKLRRAKQKLRALLEEITHE